MRVQGTETLVAPWRRERKRVRAVGIEHLGTEVVGRYHGMRDGVLVSPSDRGTRFHLQFLRSKGEVSDLDCCRIGRPDRGRANCQS